MQRRFRQAFTAIKEHGCVSYAKIATMGRFCDLDLIIVKATSPDDLPLPDRYVHELLKIFSVSPSAFRAFSLSFTRRFGKTQCWRVALKCLVLLHRLLRSLPENSPFRTELLWTRSNGLLSLYPCHFRDFSSSSSEDYTIFVRSYAQLLDEALDCLSIDGNQIEQEEEEEEDEEEEEEEVVPETLPDKMKEVSRLLELLPQLQSLLDRAMDCWPSGAAARSFLVQSATKHIIRDSFVCYTSFRKEVVVVLDNLMQMPYRSCVTAFSIYKKASIQAHQLSEFYEWCKSMGLCGSYEYPFIDRIPQIQIQALETFLDRMWQLTESSSSTPSSLTWALESPRRPSSFTEDDSSTDEQQVARSEIVTSGNSLAKKFETGEEMEPLIQLDEDNDGDSWEALLEASISHARGYVFGYGYVIDGNNLGDGEWEQQAIGWQMQIYNPHALNPFYQSHNISHCANIHGSFCSNPPCPWGL